MLSEDPAHFAIISDADQYLYPKDGSVVHVNGNPLADADPATFQVLQGPYRAATAVPFTSTSRSPSRSCRRFGRWRGPTPRISRACTGLARQSTARTPPSFGY